MSGPGRTLNCKTAVGLGGVPANVTPFPAGTLIPASGACLRLTEAEMVVVARSLNVTNPWPAGSVPGLCVDPAACGFGTESFGPVASKPFVQVEVSNPVDVPPPPGSGYDPATQRFTQVTVTVFVDVRKTGATAADAVVAGRGRLTVGPITGSAPALTAPP
jgi:hypothetical protein